MSSLEVKFTGDFISALDTLDRNIKESVLLSGAAATAKVLYEKAREYAPVSEKAHWFYGTHQKYLFQPGTLRNAIYRVYEKNKSYGYVQRYRVSWNHQKAPYGFMVEYGTSRALAHPFLGRAFQEIQSAIDAGNARMKARLSEGGRIPVAQISGE